MCLPNPGQQWPTHQGILPSSKSQVAFRAFLPLVWPEPRHWGRWFWWATQPPFESWPSALYISHCHLMLASRQERGNPPGKEKALTTVLKTKKNLPKSLYSFSLSSPFLFPLQPGEKELLSWGQAGRLKCPFPLPLNCVTLASYLISQASQSSSVIVSTSEGHCEVSGRAEVLRTVSRM